MRKLPVVSALLPVAMALSSGPAMAELTGNIGFTSNYMWRGTTQSAGDASISGGIDYGHESGLYAGIWTANTSFGSPETDFYGGFSGSAGDIEYDVGVIQYAYLQADDLDWIEFYGSVGYMGATVGLAFTDDVFGTETDAMYLSLDYSLGLSAETSLDLHLGSYDFDDEAAAAFDSYIDYSIAISKGDWSFGFSDTDLDEDLFTDGDPVFFVNYSISTDL